MASCRQYWCWEEDWQVAATSVLEDNKDVRVFARINPGLKEIQTSDYDRRRWVKDLERLKVGQRIWVKQSKVVLGRKGIVAFEARISRSYWQEVPTVAKQGLAGGGLRGGHF